MAPLNGRLLAKKTVERLPYWIGSAFVGVPFSRRLGKEYDRCKKSISHFQTLPADEQRRYLVPKLDSIVSYAVENFEFYRKLYADHGVLNRRIETLDDFKRLPILTKEVLRDFTKQVKGDLLLNTGGTSGRPFSFYIDKNAFAREWAHMHYIWSLKGYKPADLKITLRGKNLGKKNIIYNANHNEFLITAYRSPRSFKPELVALFRKHRIKFAHGYPSAIYTFLKELEQILNEDERSIVIKNLKCCLLGSESLPPYIADYLSKEWKLDYISWYGHSEMCILAYDEHKKNQYIPLQTYGYAEAADGKLIGTSYHNLDMPLIRYDTEDLASPVECSGGLLKSFSVTEGRQGDFIVDRSGKSVSLTALVFGRHHKIFDLADSIQVGQEGDRGPVTFYITSSNKNCTLEMVKNGLDLTGVDIDYKVRIVHEPIRTRIGKFKLKID